MPTHALWMRTVCSALCVGLALAGPSCTGPESRVEAEVRPPNLLLILTDDQGWGDLGCQGAEGFSTPHLDALAAAGTRFTSFYSAMPVCTPSRAALLTGCHPMRLSLGQRVLFPFSQHGLHPDETTLAELLREEGYATGCVGKWHLGHQPVFHPLRHGFERFFGVPYSNDMDGHYYKQRDFQAPPLPLYRDEEVIEESPDQALLTARYAEEAVDFLRDNAGRPFFLYLAHTMPHKPIAASEAFLGRTELGLYGDVLEELDASVGRVLAALDELGLAEETLVVFSSDNGPWRQASSGPWRGRKGTTFEGGVRVPCLVRWPGRVPAQRVSQEPWTMADLLPSFAALAGLELSGERTLDGLSVAPLLLGVEGASSPHESLPYYRDERLEAVRSGRFKLHVHRPEWGEEPHEPLLFDLESDPGEQRDVASQHPEQVARLEELAEQYRMELGDARQGVRGAGVRPAGLHED